MKSLLCKDQYIGIFCADFKKCQALSFGIKILYQAQNDMVSWLG